MPSIERWCYRWSSYRLISTWMVSIFTEKSIDKLVFCMMAYLDVLEMNISFLTEIHNGAQKVEQTLQNKYNIKLLQWLPCLEYSLVCDKKSASFSFSAMVNNYPIVSRLHICTFINMKNNTSYFNIQITTIFHQLPSKLLKDSKSSMSDVVPNWSWYLVATWTQICRFCLILCVNMALRHSKESSTESDPK